MQRRQSLPSDVIGRYSWMPADHREVLEEANVIFSPDDRAWLLTVTDFSATSDTAYAWNEWERQSLGAADDDHGWRSRIKKFWDQHLPIMMSVKSGYAYWAIEQTSLCVVAGEEPEFEETTLVAPSVLEVLRLLAARDPRIQRWA